MKLKFISMGHIFFSFPAEPFWRNSPSRVASTPDGGGGKRVVMKLWRIKSRLNFAGSDFFLSFVARERAFPRQRLVGFFLFLFSWIFYFCISSKPRLGFKGKFRTVCVGVGVCVHREAIWLEMIFFCSSAHLAAVFPLVWINFHPFSAAAAAAWTKWSVERRFSVWFSTTDLVWGRILLQGFHLSLDSANEKSIFYFLVPARL